MMTVCFFAVILSVNAPFGRFGVTVPEHPARDFLISDFGARSGVKSTSAIAAAMAACAEAGGGRVVVPAGTWLTGKVHFRSNCELHLDEGAVLEFSDDPDDYLPVVPTSWEGVECLNYSPLVYAYGVENVAITGPGELRARMENWRKWFDRPPAHMEATEALYHWCSTNAPMAARDLTAIKGSNVRPHFVQMNRVKNVRLEGFSVKESPFWMVHLYHSENCLVRGVRSSCHGHNNDGVDVEMSRNVLIEDCDFDQGDDGIVLKAGRNQDAWRLARPTENVVVRNCNLHMSHSLLGIGSELSGGVRNVWMTNCRVESTGSMFKIKTNRRRGGFVENVWLEDSDCSGDVRKAVVAIDSAAIYQWAKFPDYERRYTRIRNINVRNVHAGACNFVVDLKGDANLRPRDIRVENVSVRYARAGERNVINCENVSIRNLMETNPEEKTLEALRIPVEIPVENAVICGAFVIQLSNSLPQVKRLLKFDVFPEQGKSVIRAKLFPGEYLIRWTGKDGRCHEKKYQVREQTR